GDCSLALKVPGEPVPEAAGNLPNCLGCASNENRCEFYYAFVIAMAGCQFVASACALRECGVKMPCDAPVGICLDGIQIVARGRPRSC
ncbi:MAG: hypothetical protein WBM68_11520, partial [Woeseia sp.]